MALLNLILLPILALLNLFETPGPAGSEGGANGDGAASSAPPATGAKPGEAAAAEPATKDDGDEPLGDAGKKALDEERRARRAAEARAKAAESERDQLKTATQSDQEKALDEARKQAAAEERGRWEGRAIRADAKSALTTAGAGDVVAAVAAFLDEHRDIKVNDEGEIEDLDAMVQKFKKAHPTLFTARVPGGSADQGAKPPDTKPRSLEEAITAQLSSAGRPS